MTVISPSYEKGKALSSSADSIIQEIRQNIAPEISYDLMFLGEQQFRVERYELRTYTKFGLLIEERPGRRTINYGLKLGEGKLYNIPTPWLYHYVQLTCIPSQITSFYYLRTGAARTRKGPIGKPLLPNFYDYRCCTNTGQYLRIPYSALTAKIVHLVNVFWNKKFNQDGYSTWITHPQLRLLTGKREPLVYGGKPRSDTQAETLQLLESWSTRKYLQPKYWPPNVTPFPYRNFLGEQRDVVV